MEFKNQAIVLTELNHVEIRDVPTPELGSHDVLVKTMGNAICTQEQRAFKGIKKCDFPAVGGHECAGEVVAVGSEVTRIKVGDRVFCGAEPIPADGKRTMPAKVGPDGYNNYIQGTMRRYIVKKDTACIAVAEDVSYAKLCLASPASEVLHSINRANIQMGELVVIIGAGIMGLLHCQYAKRRGAVVVVSEVDPNRRALATKLGADYTVNPVETDPVEFIKDKTPNNGADVVINTTALHAVWDQAFALLKRPYGRIICYSSQWPDTPLPLSMGTIHNDQISIIGTMGGTPAEQFTAVRMIATGLLDVESLTDSCYKFEDAQAAFEKSIVPNTYRVIITD